MKRVVLAIAGALALYGCGGGGGGTSSESELTPTLKKGVFIDSVVEGLEYQTKSRKGLTGADGGFLYESDGETVEFFIGGKPVGFAYANPVVHVYDVSIGSAAFGGPNPARLAQLLQNLDADGNSANGIQLTSAMTSAVAAVPNINIAASDAEWNATLNSLAATIGKPVVSLEQATAHADSTLVQSNCVVADATYPFVDVYNVGKFSTSGMSCLRKARATAFFEDVYSRMDGDRSEILNSPYITNGEVLAQGEVERIARSNFASNIGKTITDQIDTRIAFLESETSKQKFALFVSGSAKLVKNIDQFAAGLCENATQCTKSDQFAGEMFPVIMDVMSNSTACVTGKIDKCSETLASSAEIGALLTESYGNLSADTTANFFKLVSAWVAVGVDLADSVKDPKAVFNLGGSFIDTSWKSATGFYFRTSEESARRTAFINNLEIAGEAIKTWSVCASALKFPTLEQSNKCLSETIDYANKRAAEIAAYSSAILTVADLKSNADDILVAQSVMSEIMRHDGFQGALKAYSISFNPSLPKLSMRRLILEVAAKYGHESARIRYALTTNIYTDRVIANLNSYNVLVKSKAAAILQGRYTNCRSAALSDVQTVGLVAGSSFDVLQLNKEAVFTTSYNPSPSIRGFLVENESGASWISGVPNVTRMHDTLGAKKVSFTPIVRGVNGGERICTSQQKTKQYLVQSAIIATPLYERYTSGSGEQCYDREIGTAKSAGVYTLSNTTYCLRGGQGPLHVGGKWVDATGVDNERYLDSQGNLYPFSSVEIKDTGNNTYTAGFAGSTIWNLTFTQKSAGVYSQSVKSVADSYSVHFDPNSYIYQNSETLPLLIAKYNAGTPYTGYLSSGGDIGFLFASSPAATEGLIYYFRVADPNGHNSNRAIVATGTWSKKSLGSNTQIIELDGKSTMLNDDDQSLRKIYYKNSSESGVREGNKAVAGRTNTIEVFDRKTFDAMLARDGLPATPN